MGRCPLLPGQHAPRLTPPQREMLRLTVQAGFCVNRTPATHHDAWSVRTGPSAGIEREFCHSAGYQLLRLGLIEITPESVPVGVRDCQRRLSCDALCRPQKGRRGCRWCGADRPE
jgi:hypothetical protein